MNDDLKTEKKENLKKRELEYYVKIEDFLPKPKFFDERGLPLMKYYATGELFCNPTIIALWGLHNLQRFLEEEELEYLTNFKKSVKFFVNNYIHKEEIGYIYLINVDNNVYNARKPWISAMTQGLVISLLLRAYKIYGEKIYLNIAEEVYKPFQVDYKKGGVRSVDKYGIWLEEVPSGPYHILNGFIYSIFGVYDLAITTKKEKYYNFFYELINTIKNAIVLYDTGYWSKYDLYLNIPAPLKYHRLHIAQLDALYRLTSEQILFHYKSLFEKYLQRKICRFRANISWRIKTIKVLVKVYRINFLEYLVIRLKSKVKK